jgi:uncharacterized phage-associated protein
MYNVNQIANFFLASLDLEAGDTISPLKLQKLLYYAQAYNLAAYEKPLFDEKIKAWMDGPVVPSIWHSYKHVPKHAAIPLKIGEVVMPNFDDQTKNLLEEIQEIYGNLSGSRLRDLTHSEAPWIKSRAGYALGERCEEEITHQSMMDFYKTKLYSEQESQPEA